MCEFRLIGWKFNVGALRALTRLELGKCKRGAASS